MNYLLSRSASTLARGGCHVSDAMIDEKYLIILDELPSGGRYLEVD